MGQPPRSCDSFPRPRWPRRSGRRGAIHVRRIVSVLLLVAAGVLIARPWIRSWTRPAVDRQVAALPSFASPPLPPGLGAMESRFAEAIRRHTEQIARHPDDAAPWLDLAVAYHGGDLFGMAVTCYEQALRRGAAAGTTWYLLAHARERSGDLPGATEAMRRASEEIDAPPKERAIPHWRLGYWLLDQGDAGAARSAFEHAVALDEDSSAAWFGLAEAALRLDDPAGAIDILERRSLLRGAERGAGHALLAAALRALGRFDAADEALRNAAPGRPAWRDTLLAGVSRARSEVGSIELSAGRLIREGRYAEALPLLQRMLATAPDDRRALNLLGTSYLRLGRHDEALRHLGDAVRIHPRHAQSRLNHAAALFEAARRAAATDGTPGAGASTATALAEVEVALELNPESAGAHELRGVILQSLGRRHEAAAALHRAAAIDERDPARLLRAAAASFEIGDWAEALVAFERYLARDPAQPLALLGRAGALVELDRFEDAEHAIAHAMERLGGPDHGIGQLRTRLTDRRRAKAGMP